MKNKTRKEIDKKIDKLLSNRRTRKPKEVKEKAVTKFVVEYKDDAGNIVSKWHYDYKKAPNGPFLVENFDCDPPKKEKKSKKKLDK